MIFEQKMTRRNIIRSGGALAPVAIFLAVYSLYWPADVPLIGPDSPSYVDFHAIRTGGYPFFLSVLKLFFADQSHYVIAQYTLYALSVLLFAWQLLKTERNLLFCLIVEVGLLANWEVNRYHFSLITETLFLSISVWFLAATLAQLRTGSLVSLAAASAAAGAAVAVRVTGFTFLAVLPVVLFAAPSLSPWVKRLAVAILPFVVVLGAESFYHRAHHPGPRETVLPILLLGKAGMVSIAHPEKVIDAAAPVAKPLQEALEYQLAPMRKLLAGMPDLATRCRLEDWYENFVVYDFAPNERAAVIEAAQGRRGLIPVALARLRMGIPDYLRLTGDHLFCLWIVWTTDNNEKAALADYLAAHAPIPFADRVLPPFEKSRAPPFPRLVRTIMLTTAALLALAALLTIIGLFLRPLALPLKLSGICGIAVHGGLILSALSSAGIPRYTIGLWPPMVVGILFFGAWVARQST
jgi:hypothetical protein